MMQTINLRIISSSHSFLAFFAESDFGNFQKLRPVVFLPQARHFICLVHFIPHRTNLTGTGPQLLLAYSTDLIHFLLFCKLIASEFLYKKYHRRCNCQLSIFSCAHIEYNDLEQISS